MVTGRNVQLSPAMRIDYWFFDFLAGGLSYRVLCTGASSPVKQ